MPILTCADALPCPWCGGGICGTNRDDYISTRVFIALVCDGCGAQGPSVRTSSVYSEAEQMHDAVVGYNTRGYTSEEAWEEAWQDTAEAALRGRDVSGPKTNG